jgi:hypothetical protein
MATAARSNSRTSTSGRTSGRTSGAALACRCGRAAAGRGGGGGGLRFLVLRRLVWTWRQRQVGDGPFAHTCGSVVGVLVGPSVVGRDWSPASSNKARGYCCRTTDNRRPPSPIAAPPAPVTALVLRFSIHLASPLAVQLRDPGRKYHTQYPLGANWRQLQGVGWGLLKNAVGL